VQIESFKMMMTKIGGMMMVVVLYPVRCCIQTVHGNGWCGCGGFVVVSGAMILQCPNLSPNLIVPITDESARRKPSVR